MKRRWFFILIILLVTVVAVLSGLKVKRSMAASTVYKGKTAKEWLNETFTTNQGQALDAFRTMGSEALPVLVGALEKQDSRLDRGYLNYYPKLPVFLRHAMPAPGLPDRERWNAASLIMMNVSYAKEAKGELMPLMADTNNPAREYVSFVAGWVGPGDTNFIPLLAKCLRDTNSVLRYYGINGLDRMGPAAIEAVPALIAFLEDPASAHQTGQSRTMDLRIRAARAVWHISGQTDVPSKVCREALDSTDEATRGWALIYLTEMRPEDVSLIPKLNEMLETQGIFQTTALSVLGKYGPAAKEAVPNLIKIINDPSKRGELHDRALRSLQSIDPEAAAKF